MSDKAFLKGVSDQRQYGFNLLNNHIQTFIISDKQQTFSQISIMFKGEFYSSDNYFASSILEILLLMNQVDETDELYNFIQKNQIDFQSQVDFESLNFYIEVENEYVQNILQLVGQRLMNYQMSNQDIEQAIKVYNTRKNKQQAQSQTDFMTLSYLFGIDSKEYSLENLRNKLNYLMDQYIKPQNMNILINSSMTENYLMKVISKHFLGLKQQPQAECGLQSQYGIQKSKQPLLMVNNHVKNSVVQIVFCLEICKQSSMSTFLFLMETIRHNLDLLKEYYQDRYKEMVDVQLKQKQIENRMVVILEINTFNQMDQYKLGSMVAFIKRIAHILSNQDLVQSYVHLQKQSMISFDAFDIEFSKNLINNIQTQLLRNGNSPNLLLDLYVSQNIDNDFVNQFVEQINQNQFWIINQLNQQKVKCKSLDYIVDEEIDGVSLTSVNKYIEEIKQIQQKLDTDNVEIQKLETKSSKIKVLYQLENKYNQILSYLMVKFRISNEIDISNDVRHFIRFQIIAQQIQQKLFPINKQLKILRSNISVSAEIDCLSVQICCLPQNLASLLLDLLDILQNLQITDLDQKLGQIRNNLQNRNDSLINYLDIVLFRNGKYLNHQIIDNLDSINHDSTNQFLKSMFNKISVDLFFQGVFSKTQIDEHSRLLENHPLVKEKQCLDVSEFINIKIMKHQASVFNVPQKDLTQKQNQISYQRLEQDNPRSRATVELFQELFRVFYFKQEYNVMDESQIEGCQVMNISRGQIGVKFIHKKNHGQKIKEILESYSCYVSKLSNDEFNEVKRNIKLYYNVYNQPLEHFYQSWDVIQRKQCLDFYQQMNEYLDGLAIETFRESIQSILDFDLYLEICGGSVQRMGVKQKGKQEMEDYDVYKAQAELFDDLYLL